jgi:alkanesulfonate monooxygenase SsuD/methylene tetrahydromethanopterin reductase-like flavin-dependent oxidoreductase (luciferase family)
MRIGVRSTGCSPTRASLLRQFHPTSITRSGNTSRPHAIGGYPFVGTPDRVADELESISKAGVRGIALSFVNYLDELPYFCAEVLPRLVRLGARSGVPASHFS